MKLRLHVVDFAWSGGPAASGPTLAAIGRAAEAAGFAAIGREVIPAVAAL